jgi:hypothetical protein
LTAAHNFSSPKGTFWVYYPDGSYTVATLVAIDRDRDLALARVSVETVLEHSYVPETLPAQGKLTTVGYTGGEGPTLGDVNYRGQFREKSKVVWQMDSRKVSVWTGHSGGGIFMDNALVGVHKDSQTCQRFYACGHNEVVAFLKGNRDVLAGCGDWSSPPVITVSQENRPPLWMPKPNVPIYYHPAPKDYDGNFLKRPSEVN